MNEISSKRLVEKRQTANNLSSETLLDMVLAEIRSCRNSTATPTGGSRHVSVHIGAFDNYYQSTRDIRAIIRGGEVIGACWCLLVSRTRRFAWSRCQFVPGNLDVNRDLSLSNIRRIDDAFIYSLSSSLLYFFDSLSIWLHHEICFFSPNIVWRSSKRNTWNDFCYLCASSKCK